MKSARTIGSATVDAPYSAQSARPPVENSRCSAHGTAALAGGPRGTAAAAIRRQSIDMMCTGIVPGSAPPAAWSRTNHTPVRRLKVIGAICGSNKAMAQLVREMPKLCRRARALATFLLHKPSRGDLPDRDVHEQCVGSWHRKCVLDFSL